MVLLDDGDDDSEESFKPEEEQQNDEADDVEAITCPKAPAETNEESCEKISHDAANDHQTKSEKEAIDKNEEASSEKPDEKM